MNIKMCPTENSSVNQLFMLFIQFTAPCFFFDNGPHYSFIYCIYWGFNFGVL
jgi:hypothetical protein